MSEEPTPKTHKTHSATTVHASKGGGAGKWLLGAAAAAVLIGGGVYAWQNYAPAESNTEIAYNDPYASEPMRAGPLAANEDTLAEHDAINDSAPAAANEPAAAPARRSTAARRSTERAEAAVPEETIGVMPVSLTTPSNNVDEIVVTARRRPNWERTPNPRRLANYYPERLLDRGREGEASLHCTVQEGGALACVRASETSSGFGAAAMRIARGYRHAPTRSDGTDATGSPVNLHVVFRIDEDGRRRG